MSPWQTKRVGFCVGGVAASMVGPYRGGADTALPF